MLRIEAWNRGFGKGCTDAVYFEGDASSVYSADKSGTFLHL
jgi:hypothetical protein